MEKKQKCKDGFRWCPVSKKCIPEDHVKGRGRRQARGKGEGPIGKPRGDVKEMDIVEEAIKLVDIILTGDYKEYKNVEEAISNVDGVLDEVENKLDNAPNQDLAELTDEVFEELSGEEEDETPVKESIVNIIRQLLKEEDFRTFFKSMMKKYKITSPAELSDEDKKKFFAAVDRGWKAKKETD